MKFILTIILSINICYAQNAVTLNKGDITPFKGVLITNEKAIELDKAQRKSLVLEDLRFHQETLIEYHRDDAKLQRKRLSEAKYDSWISNVGYFLLGTIITGVAFTVANKAKDI